MIIRPARPGDEESLASVHVRAWQTAYRGILPDAFLDAMDPQARLTSWRQRIESPEEGHFSLVAEAARAAELPTIVGFVGAGPEREGFVGSDGVSYDGEVYAIYLLAEWRRQNIGRKLMAASVSRLIDAGWRSVVIWVLKDNANARRFYEALGGALVGEKPITIGQTDLLEVAYGWADARELLAAAQRE